jgi:hypothetical protein
MKQAIKDWHAGRHGAAVRGFFKREWLVIAWVCSFLLIGIAIVQNEQRSTEIERVARETDALAEELRSSLLQSCLESRTPLVGYFHDEIASTRALTAEQFPGISPPDFAALQAEKIDRIKAVVVALQPSQCQELYGAQP